MLFIRKHNSYLLIMARISGCWCSMWTGLSKCIISDLVTSGCWPFSTCGGGSSSLLSNERTMTSSSSGEDELDALLLALLQYMIDFRWEKININSVLFSKWLLEEHLSRIYMNYTALSIHTEYEISNKHANFGTCAALIRNIHVVHSNCAYVYSLTSTKGFRLQ